MSGFAPLGVESSLRAVAKGSHAKGEILRKVGSG